MPVADVPLASQIRLRLDRQASWFRVDNSGLVLTNTFAEFTLEGLSVKEGLTVNGLCLVAF